jgi:hypothetical protein
MADVTMVEAIRLAQARVMADDPVKRSYRKDGDMWVRRSGLSDEWT